MESNVLDKFVSNNTSLLSDDWTVVNCDMDTDLPEGFIMCIEPPLLIVEMQRRTLDLDCACLYRRLASGGY